MAGLKYRWRAMRPRLASGLLTGMVKMISATMRLQVHGEPADFSRKVACTWHGRTFVFANYLRNRGLYVIISHSNDGEIQAKIYRSFGFRIIRGSTGRGGVRALVEAIRALQAGGTMAMTPDGPRGPSGEVQHGVMAMAQKGGASLVPVAFSCRPRIVFKSWDRYIVPLPFSKGVIYFGDPIAVPPSATEEEVEGLRQHLQEVLREMEAKAESDMGYQGDSAVRSLPRSAPLP